MVTNKSRGKKEPTNSLQAFHKKKICLPTSNQRFFMVKKGNNQYLLGSAGRGSAQKYSASSASFADIL